MLAKARISNEGCAADVISSHHLEPLGFHQMTRPPITHVIIMDGTLSTLHPSQETNAGLTYRLLYSESLSTRNLMG
jgi:hypothetical protein